MDLILSVRLFGSRARGDAETCSDTDILCVMETVRNEVKSEAEDLIRRVYGADISVSFYSSRRLGEMFEYGHLFAWHIYNESRFLPGFSKCDWIETLGKPRPYTDAVRDVRELAEIMSSIPENLMECPANAIFEAGLLCLCLRNIAMSLSWYSAHGLSFSRFVPFEITPPFPGPPINLNCYRQYLRCRHASTRGLTSEHVSPETVLSDAELCLEWCTQTLTMLQVYETAQV
jgi:predicted nucleotidyltransferase